MKPVAFIKFFFFFVVNLFFTGLFAQQVPIATEQWRPIYHFTPIKNWTNDPNGLIYLNGTYHLYNQQNPFGNEWGHMSWGHATSKDLIHWKHLPLAIPEIITKLQDTTWIFSGCAVWDKNNRSGFCKAGGCLVTVYTADQPNLNKESQFIAYSNDEGASFTNYEKNPVIDLQKRNFRDPNVCWNDQLQRWLMVVALPKERQVRFYSSGDLKKWDLLSEFGPQGYVLAEWECPFFLQLPVNGITGQKKWMLVVSAGGPQRGPFIQYFIGDFDGKNFKNDNPTQTVLSVDYGDCFYAAIPWNNLPGDAKTFIGWLAPGTVPTYPWKGQMSIPRDIQLKNTAEGIRLMQWPSSLIRDHLVKLSNNRMMEVKNVIINREEKSIGDPGFTRGNAYWLEAELSLGPGVTAGFKIAQKKNDDHSSASEAEIGYDAATHQLYIDRSKSLNGETRNQEIRETIDLKNSGNNIRLTILFDKSSLEIFANHGEKVLSTYIFPAEGANALSVFSVGGSATLKSLRIWDLSKL